MNERVGTAAGFSRPLDVGPFGWRDVAELLDGVDVLLMRLTAEGRVDCINRALEELTGYSSDELEGVSVGRILTTTVETQAVPLELCVLRQSKAPMQFECPVRAKQGGFHVVRFSGTVVLGPGETEHLLLVGTGTTPDCQALQGLRRVSTAMEECETLGGHSPPVHEDGGQPPGNAKIDRRWIQRRFYPYEQHVAPMMGRLLPDKDQFLPVRCHDISARGFSFIAKKPPSYEKLIVALGKPRAPLYVVAQVIHVSHTERDEEYGYRVGCRYIGRAHYDAPTVGTEEQDPSDSPLREPHR